MNAAENHSPRGIWPDGTTMWVVNSGVGKIYAYRLSNTASLSALKLISYIPPGNSEYEEFDVHFDPPFNSDIARYTASVPHAIDDLIVSPQTLRPEDKIPSFSPADDADTSTDGHQVNLTVDNNLIAVTVTNTNPLPRTRTYTVNVKREFFTYNDLSKDISLSSTNTMLRGIWANEATI